MTPLFLLCSAARVILTRVVGDADCGDDWSDTSGAFMEREIDQGDRPQSEDLAEYGSVDPSFGGDFVFLRARDSAAPQTRSLEGRDRSDADEERGGVGARASDADPAVRGAAGAWLRGRLRRRATLRQGLEPRTRQPDGERLRSAVVCAGRSLPVRLEPRDRGDGRRDDDFEGRACSPLP